MVLAVGRLLRGQIGLIDAGVIAMVFGAAPIAPAPGKIPAVAARPHPASHALVPSSIGNGRKDAPEYRFLAIREPLRQLDLPHIKAPTLPFPTQEFGNAGRFALFGVVTNRLTIPEDALIRWHRERCSFRCERCVVDDHDHRDGPQHDDEAA